MNTLTVDEVYDLIGHLGFSQCIYVLSLGFLQIFTCQHMLLNIFTGLDPSFVCYPNDEEADKEFLLKRCVDNSPEKCFLRYNDTFTSIATEWDLVCNQKYKTAAVQSVWMGGVMAGALLLVSVADHIGRLPTLMLSIIGTISFEGFSAFAANYNIYIILRFLGGMCCSLVILVSFVLSQEVVGASKRSLCGIGNMIFFSVGIALLSLTASFIVHWRALTLVTSLSGVVFILMPFFLPESPRWLASRGRVSEAKNVLETIARRNGTLESLPNCWDLAGTTLKEKAEDEGIASLFSQSYVRTLTIIQIYSWFVNSAVYYALTLAATSMGGNVYISTALNGLVEIPACLSAIVITDRYGRRIAICCYMIIGGMMCLMVPLTAVHSPASITVLALIGKLSISGSFAVIYIHSGEIFPTVIRNTGMGVVTVAARVGGIVSPFILMLNDFHPNLHFLVLGLLTVLAGLVNVKLPETLGRPTLETVADVLALQHMNKPVIRSKGYFRLSQKDNMDPDCES